MVKMQRRWKTSCTSKACKQRPATRCGRRCRAADGAPPTSATATKRPAQGNNLCATWSRRSYNGVTGRGGRGCGRRPRTLPPTTAAAGGTGTSAAGALLTAHDGNGSGETPETAARRATPRACRNGSGDGCAHRPRPPNSPFNTIDNFASARRDGMATFASNSQHGRLGAENRGAQLRP